MNNTAKAIKMENGEKIIVITKKQDRKVGMEKLHGIAKTVKIYGVQNTLTDEKTEYKLKKYGVAVEIDGKIKPLGALMHEMGLKTPPVAITLDRARVWERFLKGKIEYKTLTAELKEISQKEKEAKELAKKLTESEKKEEKKEEKESK